MYPYKKSRKSLREHQNHLEALLKCRFLGSTSRPSELTGLGWNLRICVYNKFAGDADAPVWGPYFENQ